MCQFSAFASDLVDTLPFSPYRQDATESNFGVQLDFGLTYDFISALEALLGTKNSPILLQEALNNRYGSNQETFARLKLGYYHMQGFPEIDLLKHSYIEGIGEFIFWGVAENPVVSELKGTISYLGTLSAGFTGNIPNTPISTKMGLLIGRGLARKLDVISPDLTIATPPMNESIQVYGSDLGIYTQFSDDNRTYVFGTSLDYHGSLFVPSFEESVFVNRWKSFSYAEYPDLNQILGLQIRPHLIFGPQPLPIDLLPRSWDFVHQLSNPSNFFFWTGFGSDFIFNLKDEMHLKATLGVYGKLWGAALSFELESLFIRIGSWGLSVGPTPLDNDIQRTWQGSLSFQF